jgi:hypothetical protein
MAIIQADISGMRDVASRFRSMAGQLQESQNRTLNIVGGMGQDISGMRITSLITQNMLNIQKQYEVMHDNLLKYAGFLENAAATYGETDDALKRVIAAFAGAVVGGAAAGVAVGSTPPPTDIKYTAPDGYHFNENGNLQPDVKVTIEPPSAPPSKYPSAPGSYTSPNLGNRAYYSEYLDGYTYNGVLYSKQCVGYAKGRLNELYGIQTKGAWNVGKYAAENIAANNSVIRGRDGNYGVRYTNDLDKLVPGSIVSFNVNTKGVDNGVGHVLIVEDVWCDANGEVKVRYSEANVGGTDGTAKETPLHGFASLYAGLKDFVYFERV